MMPRTLALPMLASGLGPLVILLASTQLTQLACATETLPLLLPQLSLLPLSKLTVGNSAMSFAACRNSATHATETVFGLGLQVTQMALTQLMLAASAK